MPSKKAKDRKMLKKRLREWCKKYGNTSIQIKKYKKKHGKDSVPAPPRH
jgi:hypothetical protein